MVSYYTKSIYLLGLGFTIIGFVDCCSYALDLALVSEERWGKVGYTIFNVAQCGGVAISIVVVMFASTQSFLIYALALQLVSSVFLHNFKPSASCT